MSSMLSGAPGYLGTSESLIDVDLCCSNFPLPVGSILDLPGSTLGNVAEQQASTHMWVTHCLCDQGTKTASLAPMYLAFNGSHKPGLVLFCFTCCTLDIVLLRTLDMVRSANVKCQEVHGGFPGTSLRSQRHPRQEAGLLLYFERVPRACWTSLPLAYCIQPFCVQSIKVTASVNTAYCDLSRDPLFKNQQQCMELQFPLLLRYVCHFSTIQFAYLSLSLSGVCGSFLEYWVVCIWILP